MAAPTISFRFSPPTELRHIHLFEEVAKFTYDDYEGLKMTLPISVMNGH